MQEWVASWSASVSERAELAQRLAAQVAATSATASGLGGLIEVRVDSSGVITGLHLDERISNWPAARIEREIMTTMKAAQTELADKVTAAVADTVGVDSETGRAVVAGYLQRFSTDRSGDGGQSGR